MPHGNGVSDPTARFALLSAQGWLSEDAKQVKGEIERCEAEYKEKMMAVSIVDMVMGVLTEKERYVIEAKCFEEMTWAEVEERFEKNHEHHLSIATLKRTFRSAKLKMFAIAG